MNLFARFLAKAGEASLRGLIELALDGLHMKNSVLEFAHSVAAIPAAVGGSVFQVVLACVAVLITAVLAIHVALTFWRDLRKLVKHFSARN